MSISEMLTISYQDTEHKRYAELLMRYGFSLQIVVPGMHVGMVFSHPVKTHRVYLERNEPGETLLPKLFIFRPKISRLPDAEFPQRDQFEVPMHPSHYSDFEWRALQENDPDDYTFLERELHIWFKVRPKSLNTQLRLNG